MIKFGSVSVPTSAFVFLGVVIALLIILIIALIWLNKLLCFADCKLPSAFFVDNPEKLLTDSESDDSDEDIYNNYAHIKEAVENDKIRASMRSTLTRDKSKRSIKFPAEKEKLLVDIDGNKLPTDKSQASSTKDKEVLDSREEEYLDDFIKDGITSGSFSRKQKKIAVARVHLFLDVVGSRLKIQVMQVFDLVGIENRVESKKPGSVVTSVPVVTYQVHCSILPLRKLRFKTKIRQGDDPIFNETFYVPKITSENVGSLAVRFRLYASQKTTLNVIGQCTCDLSTTDLTVDTEYNLTMNEPTEDDSISTDQISISGSEMQSIYSENIEGHDNEPELLIGLTLNSNTGRLTVEIVRGTCLSKDKNKDFYVKLSLFSATGQELSHTKTSVRKNSMSPVFRESFMFQVALFQMKEVTLMVSVFVRKSIHRKEIVGWVALGYKSSGEEESNHWNEIVEGIKTEVVRSHKLHQNSNLKKFLQ